MPEINKAHRPTLVGVQRVVGLRVAQGEEFDYKCGLGGTIRSTTR